MCGTNTYLLVLYNAINWLLPHSSKTLPGGVIPQTLAGPEGSGVQTSAEQQNSPRLGTPG